MPGPGAHMVYALGSGVGLMHTSNGRFSPHHCLVYTVNAFLGPDLGPFAEWLTGKVLHLGQWLGGLAMEYVHHPLYYVILLGFPMSVFYSWVSPLLLRKGFLHSASGVGLSREQCFLLVAAGSLSHFFLDHLFEENGQTTTYKWILSTGWWKEEEQGGAPNKPDAVIVIGLLCSWLMCGFIYINRVRPEKSMMNTRTTRSSRLILAVVFVYCLWCSSQIYLRHPPQPAIGEEADLGVLVFLCVYFFLPHTLCIFSMNSSSDEIEQLPL